MDGHELRDSLLRDAASAEKAGGYVPDLRAAEGLIVPILENLDNKDWDGWQPKPDQDTSKPPVVKPTLQEHYDKIPDRGTATVLRGDDVTRARREIATPTGRRPQLTNQRDQVIDKRKGCRLAARLRLLTRLPDWSVKLEHAYNEGARVAWREGFSTFTEMQNLKIMDVVTASDAIFGDWTKAPRRKLHFSGKVESNGS